MDDICRIPLEESEIALIGEEDLCEHFYLHFRSFLHITKYFLIHVDMQSSPKNEGFNNWEGVECIPFREQLITEQKLFLVLCCREKTREGYDKLLFNKGFQWGADYIDSLYVVQFYRHKYEMETLDRSRLQILEGHPFEELLPKKLFIAIGTCQIVNTVRVLRKNKSFQESYSIQVYFDSMYEPCSDADNRRMKSYGRFCDAVFYNIANVGTVEQRNYEPLINRFYKKAEKMFLPFYYFWGQLMQATDRENPYAIRAINSDYLWLRGDKEVNRMLEEHCDVEEIIARVSRDDYWSREEVLLHFNRELKKIAVWDRFSSFPVKPFIEKNYQNMLVFIDGTHFSGRLCFYLANEIAKRLQIELIQEQDAIAEIEEEQRSTFPLYPCVRKALGMYGEDSYRFYNVKRNEAELLDFQEYIRRYIQYITGVQKICEESGTVFEF